MTREQLSKKEPAQSGLVFPAPSGQPYAVSTPRPVAFDAAADRRNQWFKDQGL